MHKKTPEDRIELTFFLIFCIIIGCSIFKLSLSLHQTRNQPSIEKQKIILIVLDRTNDEEEVAAYVIHNPIDEELEEEELLGNLELLAQLCQAEAGNQGVYGMQLVADVVLNRVDDERFPDTIEEVIFQEGQFSVVKNGQFDNAAWNMSEEAFLASELEMLGAERIDSEILYFSATEQPVNGKRAWKYKDHWFSY